MALRSDGATPRGDGIGPAGRLQGIARPSWGATASCGRSGAASRRRMTAGRRCSWSWARPASARPGLPTRSPTEASGARRTRRLGARAGRPVERPPTGRGPRSSGPACARRCRPHRRRAAGPPATPDREPHRRWIPDRRRRRSRASTCSMPSCPSSARPPARPRWCSSSTTCTRRTSRPCCCFATWWASSPRRHWSCSPSIGSRSSTTAIPAQPCWRGSPGSRSRAASSRRAWGRSAIEELVRATVGEAPDASDRPGHRESHRGEPAVRGGDVAPHRRDDTGRAMAR